MPRNYERPRMPQNWSGEARNFYLGLIEVLDKLHLPIRKEWLDSKVQEKLDKEIDPVVEEYELDKEYKTNMLWDGKPVYRSTCSFDTTTNASSAVTSTWKISIKPSKIVRVDGFFDTSSGVQPLNSYHSAAYRTFFRSDNVMNGNRVPKFVHYIGTSLGSSSKVCITIWYIY